MYSRRSCNFAVTADGLSEYFGMTFDRADNGLFVDFRMPPAVDFEEGEREREPEGEREGEREDLTAPPFFAF
jgi:hypothetical protein